MMNNDYIKKVALDNGFKLKTQEDGSEDLNPYVYKFARHVAASANEDLFDKIKAHNFLVTKESHNLVDNAVSSILDIIDKHQDEILDIQSK